MQAMNESQRAKELAERVLSDTACDPDSDVSVLARQHLRALEQLRERDAALSFAHLRHVNVQRCEDIFHKLNDWSLTDWATAMAGECGEACNKIKKFRRGEVVPRKEIADELADMVIYCDLLAARAGIDLGESVVSKFNEASDKRGSHYKLSTDAGKAMLERLEVAESALAPIKAELTEWQTAFAMFKGTPKELVEWAVRDASRLQAVEKKLEQAVSLLRSSDEDAVSKFLENCENRE